MLIIIMNLFQQIYQRGWKVDMKYTTTLALNICYVLFSSLGTFVG